MNRLLFLAAAGAAGCSAAADSPKLLDPSALKARSCGQQFVYQGDTRVSLYSCSDSYLGYAAVKLNSLGQMVAYRYTAATGELVSLNIMQFNGKPIPFGNLVIHPIVRGAYVTRQGVRLYTVKWNTNGSYTITDNQTKASETSPAMLLPDVSDQCIMDSIDMAAGFVAVIIGGFTTEFIVGIGLAAGGFFTMAKAMVSMKTSCNR